jgi:tetratricopeptide (TPR) repeat protein
MALLLQDKYDEAIKDYDEAIRLDPKYAAAWNNKGNALSKPSEGPQKPVQHSLRPMSWGIRGNPSFERCV